MDPCFGSIGALSAILRNSTLTAHILGPYCYKPVLEWTANGRLSTKGVVTHKFALDDFKKGFDIAGKGDDSIKVAFPVP